MVCAVVRGCLGYCVAYSQDALSGNGDVLADDVKRVCKKRAIFRHPSAITREQREAQSGHKSCVVWFTGLSGAGKSTLANAVAQRLHWMGYHTFVLERVWHITAYNTTSKTFNDCCLTHSGFTN